MSDTRARRDRRLDELVQELGAETRAAIERLQRDLGERTQGG